MHVRAASDHALAHLEGLAQGYNERHVLNVCRGLLRRREEGILDEVEDSPERGSQARQVRQRRNPDKISELTSVRELLQEVTQDTHEGRHHVSWDSKHLSVLVTS